jgi:hypothetical protein
MFQTLWDKAIPAHIRIRELEEGISIEKSEVIEGTENVINRLIEGFPKIRETFDNCIDSSCPSAYVSTITVWNLCIGLNQRGVKLRFITEITKENISHCKEMTKISEVRHLDRVKGNFGIADKKDYRGVANMEEGKPPIQAIRSTVKSFVDQQQYFFETLWGKAIPARQRFKEIEQGVETEFVETIRDYKEIQQLSFDLIKKAEEEIDILFSMTNASLLQGNTDMLKLLQEAALTRDVKVRILIPIVDDDSMRAIMANEIIWQLKESGGDIRQVKKEEQLYPLQNKLALLVVDQSVCLTTELERDSEETIEEAIGLATYSNGESTVFAYSSIFENLWIHADIILNNSAI